MQKEQMYEEAATLRLYVMLFLGSLLTFALGYACALDWSVKITQSQDWMLNLIYHPLAGTLSILFLSFFVIYIVESKFVGKIIAFGNTFTSKNARMGMVGVIAASVVYLGFNSFTLIQETANEIISPLTMGLHVILGLILGFGIFALISSKFSRMHEKSPTELQNLLVACIIVTIIALVVVVMVGNALGMISLGNIR